MNINIKKPIVIEVIGLFETGKTDFCSKIPNSAMLDLTLLQESDVIFYKNRPEEQDLYFQPATVDEIKRVLRDLPSTITTVCFDDSARLLPITEKKWCELKSASGKKRTSALQIEYAELYEMIAEEIIMPLKSNKKNIVFTTGLKDKYILVQTDRGTISAPSGEKERQGIKPMDKWRDIGILLYYDKDGLRRNKITKNRFIPRTIIKDNKQIKNPNFVEELMPEANWQTLIEAITKPGSAITKEMII